MEEEPIVDPIAEPLDLPEGYGRVTKPLTWTAVRVRLEAAMHYWLVTIRPDGRPHAIPTDGIWLDGSWYFGGAEGTVHMRNVAANSWGVSGANARGSDVSGFSIAQPVRALAVAMPSCKGRIMGSVPM